MRNHRSFAGLFAPAAACLALAAGCGGAAAASSSSTRTVTRTVTVTDSSGTSQAVSSSRPSTSSQSGAVPRCRVTQLAAGFTSDGAAGSVALHFTLTNGSNTTCSLYGYPGLGLLDPSGHALSTTVLRSPSVVVPQIAERLVVIHAGGQAHFDAGYSDVDPQPCLKAATLEVTPPNAYSHLEIAAAVAPCGGVIHVSPVFR